MIWVRRLVAAAVGYAGLVLLLSSTAAALVGDAMATGLAVLCLAQAIAVWPWRRGGEPAATGEGRDAGEWRWR